MTSPTGENAFLRNLETEVEAELAMAESSHPEESTDGPADWLFDPAEVEREEVGLRSLLGAVKAMEDDSPPS